MEIPSSFLFNHFRTLFHPTEGGVPSFFSFLPSTFYFLPCLLQICPFVFNQLQDALPATLFFSYFCIVAGGCRGRQIMSVKLMLELAMLSRSPLRGRGLA